MNETTPHSQVWNQGGFLVESIESILLAGRGAQTPNPAGWHRGAIQRTQSVNPDRILESASQLLEYLQDGDIAHHIENARQSSTESLKALSMERKLFMIARDNIIMTTHKHESAQCASLRALCFHLGRMADTNGSVQEHSDGASTALEQLRNTEHVSTQSIHGTDVLFGKVATMLSSRILLNDPINRGTDSGTYHKARKDFRRVSNLYVLQAALDPSDDVFDFAARGVSLNRHYGDTADELDKSII